MRRSAASSTRPARCLGSTGGLRFAGLIGGTLAAGQGYAAFQLLALNGLSLLKSITGDLSKIRRIHRVEDAGGATADFLDVPRALSGASHLATRVFGEKGAHLRMIPFEPVHADKLSGSRDLLDGGRVVDLDLTQEFIDRAENGEVGSRLVSETDRVRVWHIQARPGERLKVHTHVLDYFLDHSRPGAGTKPINPTGSHFDVEYEAGDH